ncbi:hypothetical protein C8K11_105227 [Novosphingobium sp. GV055]|nr:hypothetical protein C8K11_105227 [Novosphingobium sp. GV055]PUB04197.1 hypothetical protein C8K12_105227 [Novosphingobium sp. GV061]PUB20588.1 hypothetical protein C8K14_105227 [Novosphingobium sp. GV079]PUB42314.1 hypothetical protein C8K10_105227 [Novosphingobium sp. GV027]
MPFDKLRANGGWVIFANSEDDGAFLTLAL